MRNRGRTLVGEHQRHVVQQCREEVARCLDTRQPESGGLVAGIELIEQMSPLVAIWVEPNPSFWLLGGRSLKLRMRIRSCSP
jgi:hypothetical protein